MAPRRTSRFCAPLAALALVLAACSDDGDGAADVGESQQTTPQTTGPGASGEDEAGDDNGGGEPADGGGDDDNGTADGDTPDDGIIRAEDGVLSDGVWAVGDAGTVEFAVTEAGLELIDVRANDGWSVTVDEDATDEIDVDFLQGNREYEIEIEYEDGILEIEIDLDIEPAEAGTFELGPAGSVELGVDGGTVTLVDLSVAEGWTITEQDTSDGEVEIELRQGNVVWELDAEIDDGQLEVEIDFEIEGRFP